MTDLLQDLAVKDDLFAFALDFVDGLPKVYNTVDVAVSKVGDQRPITVIGNITSIPDAVPVQITKKDYEEGRAQSLLNKTHFFFHMTGEGATLICTVHNVTDLGDYPYGKTDDEFSRIIQRIQYANRYGKRVQVIGQYVTLTSNRKQMRILYVDVVNVDDDALSSKMTDGQFDIFMDHCHKRGVTPLQLFIEEDFPFFDADDYLKKTVALFCLSPKSRAEIINILVLSSPGEGKDYLVDKVIQPTVKCGKVEGDQVTTTAALVGAMSTSDLNSVGVGILQKYHNERLACSEVQTWNSAKFGALLGVMANGKVIVSKGKVQDADRPACENIMMLGNIPNNWEEGMNPWDKLESVMGGKNKQYSKQLMSRFSLIFAKTSLEAHPDPIRKAKKMFKNMDDDSASADDDSFSNDDIIKGICLRTDIQNRPKAQLIRERKIEILHRAGKTDPEIMPRLKHGVWQQFFGQYFKYVSLRNVSVLSVGDVIIRTLTSMAKNEGFTKVLCNESGALDARKQIEFGNLCKAFAKVQGHSEIMVDDIREAEQLFKESVSTIVEDFGVIMSCPLDMVELDIIKFIAETQPCTLKTIREHIKMEGASCAFFQMNMDNLQKYLHVVKDSQSGEDMIFVNYDTLPEGLMRDMNIQKTDIATKDAQLHPVAATGATKPKVAKKKEVMPDSQLDAELEGVDLGDE